MTGVDLSGVLEGEVHVGTDGVGCAAGIEAVLEGVEVGRLASSAHMRRGRRSHGWDAARWSRRTR